MATATQLTHEATGSRLRMGAKEMGTTMIDEIGLHTPMVITLRQRYTDADMDFTSEDVHVLPRTVETARFVSDDTGDRVVVKFGKHETLYLPVEVAAAVAAALDTSTVDQAV